MGLLVDNLVPVGLDDLALELKVSVTAAQTSKEGKVSVTVNQGPNPARDVCACAGGGEVYALYDGPRKKGQKSGEVTTDGGTALASSSPSA